MPSLKNLKSELKKLADKKQAAILTGFFKTGKGQYGEGDIFLGIKVPAQRKVARQYENLSLADAQKLLHSKIHEQRLIALLILLSRYKKADDRGKKKIVDFYLKNTKNINNWDLVDLSCHYILGDYLLDKPRRILYKLARSKNLWEKRIAIISTFAFLRNKQFNDTLKISEILLNDRHDLIHKASGWMLREAGKRDQAVLEKFLDKHYKIMPRVMLRYAIEKLSEGKRKFYLDK
ncbi:DNA alkylation repair protein [Candidatus Falkowbacteria bacterium]|nr:DNA alkylation repair protein [Candidatus Falkowbacteria bacterium]